MDRPRGTRISTGTSEYQAFCWSFSLSQVVGLMDHGIVRSVQSAFGFHIWDVLKFKSEIRFLTPTVMPGDAAMEKIEALAGQSPFPSVSLLCFVRMSTSLSL
jgi:hypothetical protein